jgi:hypothetical protein
VAGKSVAITPMSKTEEHAIVIADSSTEASDLKSYLLRISCAGCSPGRANWEADALSQSPVLGKYFVSGIKNRVRTASDALRLELPQPTQGIGFHPPAEMVFDYISVPLAIACAAGGCKVLVELIKAWVEDRKGRRVKFKTGDIELEIQGSISQEKTEQLIEMLEKKFTPSRLIEP